MLRFTLKHLQIQPEAAWFLCPLPHYCCWTSDTMPLRPWQPTSFSTPKSSNSLPPTSFSLPRSNVSSTLTKAPEDKENRPTQRWSKPGVSTSQQKNKKTTPKPPNMLSRRNERERNRVHLLNLGFDRLRAVVPKREGEHLSKISTLKKAIWYIEHLDRVLHEGIAPEGTAIAADSEVVGTGLENGSFIATLPSRHPEQSQEQYHLEGKRLSPIFPTRMDEPSPDGPLKSLDYINSTSDSGYISSFCILNPRETLQPLPPVRMWTIDSNATSSPNRWPDLKKLNLLDVGFLFVIQEIW